MDIMDCRRDSFVQLLAARSLKTAVVCHPHHIFYLTGYLPHASLPSYLVIHENNFRLINPGKWVQDATGAFAQLEIHGYMPDMGAADCNALHALQNTLDSDAPSSRQIGIDLWNLSAYAFSCLNADFQLVDIGGDLLRLELRKDQLDLDRIKGNLKLNDEGFAAAQAAIRPGVSELEVYAAIQAHMTVAAGYAFALTGGFVSGERAYSTSGSQPTARSLQSGDLFIIDLYPTIRAYRADTTRTFVVGEPSKLQLQLHAILEEALAEVEKAISPGARCVDLNKVVRGVIAAHGYDEYFTHHTGHGIGLFTAEPPYIEDSTSPEVVLQEGSVLAIEPGIYIPGVAGLRLEENYLVSSEGLECLSHFPRRLIGCPA